MQKLLIITGLVLLTLGLIWPLILKFGLGHLPGDIIIKRGSTTFFFPLTSCLLVSLALSAIAWLLRFFRS